MFNEQEDMSKKMIADQDDQVNEIIERICEIAGKALPMGQQSQWLERWSTLGRSVRMR